MTQLDLFPRATAADIKQAKRLLCRYAKYTANVNELERRGVLSLSSKQLDSYHFYKNTVDNLDSAVRTIIDKEIQEIVKYRYMDGQSYTATIAHFSSKMDDRTVDRKLNKGIAAVADTLLWL
ncbi:hypothetical protein EBB07_00865 [Paenibacillaceae bacterium]|nr:hypothetical protein EBB07_00865 [Paenibacillaceae bacterium]